MSSIGNVLFISYDGLTDPLGQSQVIPYLAGLSEKGFQITILSCEKKDRYAKYSASINQLLTQHNLSWEPVRYTKNFPVLSPFYNLIKMYFSGKKIIQKNKFQLFHCRSILPAIIGMLLIRKNPAKLLFDMRGFWADERVEGGLWPQSNIIYRFLFKYMKKKEKMVLKNSDHIISLTLAGKNIIEQGLSAEVKRVPITIIPCCTDLLLFNPMNLDKVILNAIKEKLQINENTFVMAYLGSIGTWYMLDEMLMFFKLFNKEIHDSCLLFITNDDPGKILPVADKIGLNKSFIKIIAAQRKEIPSLLSLCNATIFFIQPSFSKQASSPTKLGESLAMGVPVVCNSGVGDCDFLMSNNNIGWVINKFDESSYLNIINKIIKNTFPVSDEVRKTGEQYFSLEKAIEKYTEVYIQLLA